MVYAQTHMYTIKMESWSLVNTLNEHTHVMSIRGFHGYAERLIRAVQGIVLNSHSYAYLVMNV